ncbi:MAG TPA: inorganic phosphate transporter [Candidatus Limnocylindria bacterium]|nr:inorganic phosphate transporter [Candidatus Limnocylindria bacterium]
MTLLFTVIIVALIFEYINGFHDTANSIATVVSTKVLTPRMAIAMAAVTNLWGALVGSAVAKSITSGLVNAEFVTTETIVCALLAGIIWNLLTWWFGIPSSSTHALVGGLAGATLAGAHGNWGAIIWAEAGKNHWWEGKGILLKVIIPMITSPLVGFGVGLIFMTFLYALVKNWRPGLVASVFGKAQLISAGYMGFSHGTNDAQKTMGIIALTLAAAAKAGTLTGIPGWLDFLNHPMMKDAAGKESIHVWIKVLCAIVMCAGTAAGGWRIIHTMGHKMVKLQPIHGFAAETTAATVLMAAGHFGMPVSTTHAITTSIMGVGCAKRFSALKLGVIERIIWAWILTLPLTALVGYALMELVNLTH